jgi:cell division protein FtsW
LLLRIEWESRTVLGSEDAEFSEDDFAEAPAPKGKGVAHGR